MKERNFPELNAVSSNYESCTVYLNNMEKFFTFLIITYRRPDKVARLLRTFLDSRWNQLSLENYEIVIADDHGEDNTGALIQPIITELEKKGWTIRYIYRDTNLRGDRNLYNGYSKDSAGEFVWFLCDDDIIDVSEAINYIEVVKETQPLLAICGFEQGDKNQYGNKFEGDVKLINNFSEAIDHLIKFPKTTAYLMRRCPEVNLDLLFEKFDRTLFSWIGLSIYLFGKKKNEKLLIYPKIVGRADEDYSLLPYSYRTFGKMGAVVKAGVDATGQKFEKISPNLKNLKSEDEIVLHLNGLQAHYSWRTPIRYTSTILEQELQFFRGNWRSILHSRSRIIALLKFSVYRILSLN